MTEVNMRNAFLSILAGLLLLGAPGAAAAGSCQSANGCASLEHDATSNAGKVLIVNDAGTSLVSGGLKSVIVDTSGDSAVDATANAVKTVDVDNAGAALVGGRGSRVELLYSGTHTTLTGAGAGVYAPIRGAFAPPAWCRTVVFTARIDAITIGAGATLTWAGARYDSNGEVFTTSAGAERGMEAAAVATPTVNNGAVLSFGSELPALNTNYSGTTVYSVPTPPLPQIGFVYNWVTAPDSWSVRWTAHCID